MKVLIATALCSLMIVGQASAQYYYPRGEPDYYAPRPPPPRAYYQQQQYPMGWGEPYPARYGYNGQLYCTHRNYRPIDGWCQRVY